MEFASDSNFVLIQHKILASICDGVDMRPHLSINVGNLARSVEFYSRVFGQGPQKQSGSYAKFDLKTPAFNFSMHEAKEGRLKSRVNHLGIEVGSAEEVREWQARLDGLGLAIKPEEDSTCCFARQDKVWFADPDGNAWEVFFVHEQLPVVGEEPPKRSAVGCAVGSGCC